MTIIYLIIIIAFSITLFIIIRSAIIRSRYKELLTNISNEISEGYIIFTKAGIITDYNKAVLKELGITKDNLNKKSIFDVFNEKNYAQEDIDQIKNSLSSIENYENKISFDIKKKNGKIFNLELRSIVNNDVFLRFVMVIKNVTHNYEIIDELYNNQDMTANREKFAILGQLVSRFDSFFKITNLCSFRRS